MIFYNASKQMALKELASDEERGLTEEQAAERLDEVGPNKLKEKKKKTNLQRFADQFKDVMILILLAAAAVSFVVACV